MIVDSPAKHDMHRMLMIPVWVDVTGFQQDPSLARRANVLCVDVAIGTQNAQRISEMSQHAFNRVLRPSSPIDEATSVL